MATIEARLGNEGYEKVKNPGRVKAAVERWHSAEPKWVEWRRKLVEDLSNREFTEETRRKIGDSKRGKKKDDEFRDKVSTAKGGVREKVFGLFKRDWPVEDVVRLGFERRQVTNLLARLRKSGFEYDLSDKERMEIRRRPRKRPYAEFERNSSRFAQRLLEMGLVSNDLVNYNRLKVFYQSNARPLSGNKSDLLRLEIFLTAILSVRDQRANSLRVYRNLGKEVDAEWFNSSLVEEEEFILSSVGENVSFYGKRDPLRVSGYTSWRTIEIKDDLVAIVTSPSGNSHSNCWIVDCKQYS